MTSSEWDTSMNSKESRVSLGMEWRTAILVREMESAIQPPKRTLAPTSRHGATGLTLGFSYCSMIRFVSLAARMHFLGVVFWNR